MRILFVLPSTSTGGIEKLVIDYSRLMLAMGHFCDVLAFSNGKNTDFDLFQVVHIINVKSIDPVRTNKRLLSFFEQHNKYDVVHSNVSFLNGVVAKCAKMVGIKRVIAHAHLNGKNKCSSFTSECYHRLLAIYYRRLILKYSDTLLACSYSSGDYLFGSDSKYIFFPNCINVSQFAFDPNSRADLRKRYGFSDDAFIVMHVGRFAKVKNHLFIIEVFLAYLKQYPNSFLVLFGEGELKLAIEEMVKNKGIGNAVRFMGYCGNVAPFYSMADLFLLPSFIEGFPVSLVEAQASGIYSITSDAIPDEVIITDAIERIALTDSVKHWTSRMSIHSSLGCREEYASYVKAAGYDLKNAIQQLLEIYNAEN